MKTEEGRSCQVADLIDTLGSHDLSRPRLTWLHCCVFHCLVEASAFNL